MMRPVSWVLEEEPRGTNLVVTGAWTPAAADVLRSRTADGLTLNYARGFVGGSLDFLDPAWQLRRLHLLDRSIVNLSPLDRLGDSLEELSIQAAQTAELDLAPLAQLRSSRGRGGFWGPRSLK